MDSKKRIINFWENYSGSWRSGTVPGFKDYLVPGFFKPFGSPNFLTTKNIGRAQLEKLIAHFKFKQASKTPNFKPYFNYLTQNKRELSRIEKVIHPFGWRLEKNPTVNIWTKPIHANVPKDISVMIGSYFNPTLRRDYMALNSSIFKVSRPFMNRVYAYSRKTQGQNLIVLLKKLNRPIAVGVIGIGKTQAQLFGGCIHPRFRRRGFWRLLVSLRQKASIPFGVNHWHLNTENSIIAGKSHKSIFMGIFTKGKHKLK